MFLHGVVVLSVVLLTTAVPRPHYLIPCSISKNFSKCALESARHAIPYLIKGDKQLKIPSMNPVRVESIELKGSNHLHLKLRNVELYGLNELKILNVWVDFKKQKARIISSIDKTVTLADYEMTGHIILPISGHGRASITVYNAVYQYDATWKTIDRNGKRYMNVTDSKYDYEADKITFDFENLFNGDPMWSRRMNQILNDNWKEVNADLKGAFLETILTFHNDLTSKIFSQIPYDDLFLP